MGTLLTVICAIGGACVFIGGTYLIIKKFKKKKDNKKGNEGNENNQNGKEDEKIKINNNDDLSNNDTNTNNNIDNSRLISDFSGDEQDEPISIIIMDKENNLENKDNISISSKSNKLNNNIFLNKYEGQVITGENHETYTIKEYLGIGQAGIVYSGINNRTKEIVALKIIF